MHHGQTSARSAPISFPGGAKKLLAKRPKPPSLPSSISHPPALHFPVVVQQRLPASSLSSIWKLPELHASDYQKRSNYQPKFIHDQFITRKLRSLLLPPQGCQERFMSPYGGQAPCSAGVRTKYRCGAGCLPMFMCKLPSIPAHPRSNRAQHRGM